MRTVTRLLRALAYPAAFGVIWVFAQLIPTDSVLRLVLLPVCIALVMALWFWSGISPWGRPPEER